MVVNRNPEYFLMIAQECSICHAAEKLYISQSSLSQHLAKLEAGLEVKLFDRSTNPIRLTGVSISNIWKATAIFIRSSNPT